MGQVWIATHNADSWQAAGAKRYPVWFALVNAEDIRTVYVNTREGAGTSVVALVKGSGLDGSGDSTVLASRSEPAGAQDLPALPPLFHLDLIETLHQARQLDEATPVYVRAECEKGSWRWRVYTYEQLRERIEMENLAAEAL
ncbi:MULTISPECIES: hypothetical protein [unclassified Streptomyces]|uniref:hypothetical protein n=1 Tax=unclassified Streptomyces TaxID=2593676 RepID=UPI00236604FD|nr:MULTISPECIES: hypothetical protein [unclassified Streptomyces]MDF3144167.1 hypothetical protein [Streptomyces sp. T21Q-yed]WDF45079.1 hypothetical protein PBV52_51175 [Streptomyces sp. T12]